MLGSEVAASQQCGFPLLPPYCSAPSSPGLWQRVLWGHASEWDEGVPGHKSVSAYHLFARPETPRFVCLLWSCTRKMARIVKSSPGCAAVPKLLLPGFVSESLGSKPLPCSLPGFVSYGRSSWFGESLGKSPSLPPLSSACCVFVPYFPVVTGYLPG